MAMNSREVMTLVLFQNFGEMARVAGDQIVGAGGVGAFDENVVVDVVCGPDGTCWGNEMRSIFDELEKLLPKAAADLEFRTREDGCANEKARIECQANGVSNTEGLATCTNPNRVLRFFSLRVLFYF